ncbi:MAG: hypothetical protein ACI4T5_02505 [Prevotella sp.]
MKRKNARFELEQERFDDLMRVFHSCLAVSQHVNNNQLLEQAIKQPSSRFWVTEERATIVIGAMLRGKSIEHMCINKQLMYQEIYRRVVSLLDKSKDLPVSHAVAQVITQKAPCFYMGIDLARKCYYSFKKQWYLKRFKRYRYLAGVLDE